jgi:hypothetical protein
MEKPGGGEDANFTGDGVAPRSRLLFCAMVSQSGYVKIAMERSTIFKNGNPSINGPSIPWLC